MNIKDIKMRTLKLIEEDLVMSCGTPASEATFFSTPTAWRSGGFNPQKPIRITNVQ